MRSHRNRSPQCCFQLPQLPQLPKLPEPEDVDGAAGSWMGVVRRCKSLVDIFPPLSVGFGAGVAIGCGVGWPIKQMVGPPKAFCGPGIGLGVGVGYGQGPLGKRFSEDTRNEESLQRIETFEKSVDALVDNLINKAKGITGWKS